MSQPYVIHIYVAEGDPEGVRLVEKSNWTGKGIVFSRSDLAAAKELGADAPGVYVLVGDDPEGTHDLRIYVGQGEDVHKRLGDHVRDDAKEFWNETIVFVSSSGTLNRAHVVYLESKLIELAQVARRVSVANSNRPTLPSLSLADRAEADGFLREMLAIYPVLGLTAFEKPVAAPTSHRRYYLNGPDTAAEGEDRSDGFLVMAGGNGADRGRRLVRSVHQGAGSTHRRRDTRRGRWRLPARRGHAVQVAERRGGDVVGEERQRP